MRAMNEVNMRPSTLKYVLAASVLLNLGVVAAVGYTAAQQRYASPAVQTEADAVDALKLTPEQRKEWHALETDFLRDFRAELKEIEAHREKLVRAIFSDRPDLEAIEAERATIAKLQTEQQKRVIGQLLKERALLDPSQRQALADLLLRQPHDANAVERLHRR
jgi:Spy/CpxP family protein refolding chaperone